VRETLEKIRFAMVEALFIALLGAVGGLVGGAFAYAFLVSMEWMSR
jgi:hypothetical protein